jgi:glycosyltransferase involved in cell wall biosynthesis
MIVRNEERTLRSCLESVGSLADEMIVVDTGSSDGTREVALGMGARVVEVAWTDDFSAARNAGLEQARGAWILVLDADESLAPEAREAVRALTAREPREAHALVQVGLGPLGQTLRMPIVRLFPNHPDVRFEFPLHEQVDRSLARRGIPVRPTTIEIQHSGYDSPARAAEKRARYRNLIAGALAKGPAPEVVLHLLYLRAVSFFEGGEWREAADAFAEVLGHAPSPKANIARFARLRAAEALLQVGDWRAALAHLPERPDQACHPAELFFRARIESTLGHPGEARPWYEAILALGPGPWQPAVDVDLLKRESAAALAEGTGSAGS